MQLDVITLSKYRLNRSKEDLEAAISNHESGFYKVAINRSNSFRWLIFSRLNLTNKQSTFLALPALHLQRYPRPLIC